MQTFSTKGQERISGRGLVFSAGQIAVLLTLLVLPYLAQQRMAVVAANPIYGVCYASIHIPPAGEKPNRYTAADEAASLFLRFQDLVYLYAASKSRACFAKARTRPYAAIPRVLCFDQSPGSRQAAQATNKYQHAGERSTIIQYQWDKHY
jgi:hypothetical protein